MVFSRPVVVEKARVAMMMEFPLAHDEAGNPIEVPGTASGWLVRRHGGGRGRPAAVYDGAGRPLVVALEATAADLREAGCAPGRYRLDAVNGDRKVLEATAYTEVVFDAEAGDELGAAVAKGGADAAVAALARAVEAMQRVQAERERAQAERERAQADMIARLVERLAPPPPPVPRSMREVLGEFSEVQKALEGMAPAVEDAAPVSSGDGLAQLSAVAAQLTQMAMMYWQHRVAGASAAASVTETTASGSKTADASVAASVRASRSMAKEPPTGEATNNGAPAERVAASPDAVNAKLEAVLRLLTDSEAQRVRMLSRAMPAAVLEQALAKLAALSPQEGAAELRRLLGNPAAVAAAAGGIRNGRTGR